MSELDPDELVLDVHLDIEGEKEPRTIQACVRLANPTICKRKDATGNLQFPLGENLKRAIELRKAIKRYTGAIRALETAKESLKKIDQDALPCGVLPTFVGDNLSSLEYCLLGDMKSTLDVMQESYKSYMSQMTQGATK